jgi:hypothetical protein
VVVALEVLDRLLPIGREDILELPIQPLMDLRSGLLAASDARGVCSETHIGPRPCKQVCGHVTLLGKLRWRLSVGLRGGALCVRRLSDSNVPMRWLLWAIGGSAMGRMMQGRAGANRRAARG